MNNKNKNEKEIVRMYLFNKCIEKKYSYKYFIKLLKQFDIWESLNNEKN